MGFAAGLILGIVVVLAIVVVGARSFLKAFLSKYL